jgi:hypothetical protein
MLSGRHPWSYHNGEFPTQKQICDLQVNAAPRPLKGIRKDVCALIEKALCKRPEDRYADMDQLAAATWDLRETIRLERSAPDQAEDRRNPPAADGSPLGPHARRAFQPAHTPAQETPPPLPARKVELYLVKNEGREASLPPPPSAGGEAPKRAAVVHETVKLDGREAVPEPTAAQWLGGAAHERTTGPMPAPGTAARDHMPAWMSPAQPQAEVPHFLDYIVPPGMPAHVPPSSTTPTLVSVQAEAGRAREEEGVPRGDAPPWLVVLMLVSAIASTTIAVYYVFFAGRGAGGEPAAAVAVTATPTVTAAPAAATATAAATASVAATASAKAAKVAPVQAPHVVPAAPKASASAAPKASASVAPAVSPSAPPRNPNRLMDVED